MSRRVGAASLAVVLCMAGAAGPAAADAWRAKSTSRKAGRPSWDASELVRVGRRLQRMAAAAPAGKGVALHRAGLAALGSTALRDRRLRAERQRPPTWRLRWRPGGETPATITVAPDAGPQPALRPAGTLRGRAAATALEWLRLYPDVFALDDPRDELAHVETVHDDDGRAHVRFGRRVDGVPVWGEDLVLHLRAGGDLYAFNGSYSATPAQLPPPAAVAAPAAVERALAYVSRQTRIRALGERARQLLDYEGPAARLYLQRDGDGLWRRVWYVEVRPNLRDRWLVFVDATSGAVVEAFNATPREGPATVLAADLNGEPRALHVFGVDDAFVMVDGSRPMFAEVQPDIIDDPLGAIVTYTAGNRDLTRFTGLAHVTSSDNTWPDAVAVSAHTNMGVVFDYFLQTHGRLSIDGRGGSMFSVVHVTDEGAPMDNAFWNGAYVAYGDGNSAFAPLAKALDVAAHEMTHGVIQNTVNLEYRNQSGALNESFADVFAAMVDRDDWRMGEDVVRSLELFPSGALRDMSNPHNGSQEGRRSWQPAHMSEFRELPGSVDNGGVHVNSGIPNRACFLIATALGRDKTERIYYHILSSRLIGPRGNFVDMRRAAIQAATDLFGAESTEAETVTAAFTQVGIVGEVGYQAPERRDPVPGEAWLLVVNAQGGNRSLYLVPNDFDSDDDLVLLTPTQVFGGTGYAATVAADGSFVLFVDAANDLRSINIDGSKETVISDAGDWASIALSPDGRYLAATSVRRDAAIVLIDMVDPERTKTITLERPTTQAGVSTGVVLFADAMDWDPDGQFLIYDAFNAVPTATGDSLSFWDVSLLEPEEEYIVPLLPPQPRGLLLGNPSFARTTAQFVAIDRFDENVDSNEVWVLDLVTGDAGFIVGTSSSIAFPNFSVDDGEIAYEYADGRGRSVVARIELTPSRLAAAGPRRDFLLDARSPTWLAIAAAGEPTSVEEAGDRIPTESALRATYPNPFNASTVIPFELASPGHVTVTVYDMRGARVVRLLTDDRGQGAHRVRWDGLDDHGRVVASGVYVVRLQVRGPGDAVLDTSRRLALVR